MKAKETKIKLLVDTATLLFPNAACELNHSSVFELTIAVILSAQTTDPSVNKVTPALFKAFPDALSMAEADLDDLEKLIHSIGLYKTKAKHIKALSKMLIDHHHGEVPDDFDQLQTLPGIGRKTANVVLAVGFNKPGLAVDTHVLRVSRRFGVVALDADPTKTELVLKKALPQTRWSDAHHAILFFGRYHCTARKPHCEICPLSSDCTYYMKTSR